LLAEVAAKDAEAAVIEKRMIAEAKGIAEKADAMKHLDGSAREHEEFRLRLENERQIALKQIEARVSLAEQQSKVMAEAMGNADIKIVGGDGQFFDRFVKAVSLGNAVDGVLESSETVRKLAAPHLNGNGHDKDLTISKVLGGLLVKADDQTKTKLQALIEKAKQLGVHDDKVS
jgi:hypothetical protein